MCEEDTLLSVRLIIHPREVPARSSVYKRGVDCIDRMVAVEAFEIGAG